MCTRGLSKGKQRALSLEVTCNVKLHLKIGRTSVKVLNRVESTVFSRSNYRCLHTGVPFNTAYGWNKSNVKAQWSLFTYIDKLTKYRGGSCGCKCRRRGNTSDPNDSSPSRTTVRVTQIPNAARVACVHLMGSGV